MRKIIRWSFVVSSIMFLSAAAAPSDAEDVDITTSYPSPYGIYQGLSSTDDTELATNVNKTLFVGTTTYPFGQTPPKLYVLGSAEADAFRAYETSGVYAFIESGTPPDDGWADIGGANILGGYAPTHLDGSPLALQVKSAGNVGIGTANPQAKLDVVGKVLVNGGGIIHTTNATQLVMQTVRYRVNYSIPAGVTIRTITPGKLGGEMPTIIWPKAFSGTPVTAFIAHVDGLPPVDQAGGYGGFAEMIKTLDYPTATGVTLFINNPQSGLWPVDFNVTIVAIGPE